MKKNTCFLVILNLLRRIHNRYIELRVKTTGYSFRFHSGLKARLYYIDHPKMCERLRPLRWAIEGCESKKTWEYEFFGYDSVSLPRCYVLATRIQGEEVYFVKWPEIHPDKHLFCDIKSKTFAPAGEMYGFFKDQLYEKSQMGFLFAAVNNACRPSVAKLLS